ncbi:MAG: hypothetical protein P0Y56_16015 [Candidatus Andeanibacterium colombiense]|uniref:Lipoprotein n=1 Tax=Candidatus Andeanibacterium colombiense TaxID=3121345 RepID=A0AAJ6BMW9_9SPHN|nr:MAG: hypothetical protein P0Y56_16015 [Sphingomonadaceae bacterium]
MKPSALIFVASLAVLSGCRSSGLPNAPLFDGVDGMNYARGTQIMQDRLQSHFPVGSSDRKLATYLEQQGLRIEHSSPSDEHIASLKYGGPICGSQVRVQWVADNDHVIRSMDVIYTDTGCP